MISTTGRMPDEAHAQGDAEEAVLADRRVPDALRAELLGQADVRLEHAAIGRRRPRRCSRTASSAGHRVVERGVDRLAVGQLDRPPRPRGRRRLSQRRHTGASPRGSGRGPSRHARRRRRSRPGSRRGSRPGRSARSAPSATSFAPRSSIGSRAFQRIELAGRPVLGGVGPAVAAVAVGLHLEEAGAVAAAGPARRPRRVAAWTASMSWPSTTIPGMPNGSARRARSSMGVVRPQRAVLAVQVVGDDEHDRRLPDGGHVERLVERPDVRRPVAEERQSATFGLLLHLEGDRRADRDRQPGADDGVRADVALARSRSGASSPPTPPEPPVGRPISSAKAVSGVHAQGQRLAVAAIGVGLHVARAASPRSRRPRRPPGPGRGGSCPGSARS